MRTQGVLSPPNHLESDVRWSAISRAYELYNLAQLWDAGLPKRVVLKRMLDYTGLMVRANDLDLINDQVSFEVWTSNFEFLFACGTLYSLTSWSARDLLERPWQELLIRDPEMHTMLVEGILAALKYGETQQNVTPEHLVTENKANAVNVFCQVHAVAPVFSDDGRIAGFMGVTTLKPQTS